MGFVGLGECQSVEVWARRRCFEAVGQLFVEVVEGKDLGQ